MANFLQSTTPMAPRPPNTLLDLPQSTTPVALPPANTLMGLPTELKALIIRPCVIHPHGDIYVVDRFNIGFGHHEPTIYSAQRELLAPFHAIGNHELLTIAEQEFYRANTMRADMVAPRYYASAQAGASVLRYIADDPLERANVQNLRIKLISEFCEGRRHPDDIADFGKPEAAALLKGVPSMYPKLRSFTFEILHNVCAYQRRTARPEDEGSLARAEIAFVANILGALREVKRTCRNARVSLRFVQKDDPLRPVPFADDEWREAAEIDGVRVSSDEELAWQVLDLPVVVVAL
ncbi:hypothetical protein LTR85_007124 [Meristemomyces frigidus]|nr:hypothetical protein LTR85_007124 [Meristemomyces frigidus]